MRSTQNVPSSTTGTAIVGINVTALILLAYVAMVIAREPRRWERPSDHAPVMLELDLRT